MMRTPGGNEAKLRAQLEVIPEALERLNYLVGRTKLQGGLDGSERLEAFKVYGCYSDVWIVPDPCYGGGGDGPRLRFRSGSDAPVAGALAALLCEIYEGCRPEDIAAYGPTLFESSGILRILSQNRRHGLEVMHQKITGYAKTYLAGKGAG